MKKNLLIMMMMVLCAGFVSAQTINTVRGFVPGGSTGAANSTSATYAVFGQPFATIANNNDHEVSVGLAQMQLITDSITDVVACAEGYHRNGFDLTPEQLEEYLTQCEMEGKRGYLRRQTPNAADQDYYYDSLVVVDLYVCPCTASDGQNEYDVIALNGECWFKTNMRKDIAGSMVYNSELNTVDPENEEDMITFGRLYTYETVINGATSCEDGFVQGICPEKWHLPSVEEMDPLFGIPAENLRIDGNWIVNGNNNLTEFSAEPAGFYNSISQRFEGMLTETDFWMVDCTNLNPENGQLPVFQLIYSCNTPLRPNRPVDDAISVRCVYDIVKMLEDCEPELDPNSCPTLGNVNLINTADGIGFTAHINNYVSGTTATVIFTAGYDMSTVPGTAGSTTPDFGFATPQIDVNGDFTWLYEPAQGYDIQYLTGITANVEITTEDDCNKQSGNFNVYQKNETPQTECDFTVGPANFSDGVGTVQVTNYSTYFENDNVDAFIAVYHGSDEPAYYSNSDNSALFNITTEEGITTISDTLPSNVSFDGVDSIKFYVYLTLKQEYLTCAENDGGIDRSVVVKLNNNCPSYGTPDLQLNGQYFIPVTNYDYENGDAFTVTCVFNVGNIEQSVFEEHAAGDGTGYSDGILVVNLGDVPTYYCGLSFKIKLNNSCEETVIAKICE